MMPQQIAFFFTLRFLGTTHILRSVDHDLAQDDAKDAPPPVLDAGGLDVDVPEGSEVRCPISDMQLIQALEFATSLSRENIKM